MSKNKIPMVIVPESICRSCYHKLDANTPVEGDDNRLPMKDDLSVCAYCGTWSKFDEHQNLLPLTPEDIEDIIKNDPGAYAMLIKASAIIKKIISQQ